MFLSLLCTQITFSDIKKIGQYLYMWDELTFLWNELTTLQKDPTIEWNDLILNDLTMERNGRKPLSLGKITSMCASTSGVRPSFQICEARDYETMSL